MASRKNTRPIHDITVRKGDEVLSIVACTACMSTIKLHLDAAEAIFNSIAIVEDGFECEAGCSR